MKKNKVSLWDQAAEASGENIQVNLIITYCLQKPLNQFHPKIVR